MQYQEKKGVPFLQSELLLKAGFDKHAFFLKGVSFSDDDIDHALSSMRSIFPLDTTIYMKQEHKTEIATITKPLSKEAVCMEGVDGLITQRPGCALLVKHADCQAALIVDPKKRVAVALHVGWKGSVAYFFEKAFAQMKEEYGSNPADCLIAISPSLGPNYAEFKGHESYFPASFSKVLIHENYFDFWLLSSLQLQALGVQPSNIDIARVCTYSNKDACYSYRRFGSKKEGLKRHGSFIAL